MAETRLHGLMDGLRLTIRRLDLNGEELIGLDRALAVDGVSERVDDAAHHGGADGDGHDLAGPLDDVAFLDLAVVTEQRGTDVVFLKVEDHAHQVAGELEELARHGVLEAIQARDTVTD